MDSCSSIFPHSELNLGCFYWRRVSHRGHTYVVSKCGRVGSQDHLCKQFRGSLRPETSSLSLSFPLSNIHSPGSHTPFTHHRQLRPQSSTAGSPGRWRWRRGGGEGMKSAIVPKPIRADQCQSAMCGQTTRLNPTQCMLRPYLGEAKYTLSYQRQWMSDWNSQFFPQMQTHLLRSAASSCTNQNQCGKEER